MEFTFTFIGLFFLGIYLTAPLVVFLFLVIAILGIIVGRIERWSHFDAIYWAFITALTVGFGDIRPHRKHSKMITIAITLAGIMFSGIFVAITVRSAIEAFKKHGDQQVVREITQGLSR